MIWVGTDDGNVQLTRDGGKTWTNVVGNVTGLPASIVGELGRGEPLRRRHRLRDVRPPHLRRHDAVGLPDRPTTARPGQRIVGAATQGVRGYAHVDQGGHGRAEPALPRHRVRPVDLASTAARSWARVQGRRLPGGRGARPRDPAARQRSRDRDARPRHLDHRRHHAAARAQRRHARRSGRRSCRRGRCSSACAPRRLGRGRRGVRRARTRRAAR